MKIKVEIKTKQYNKIIFQQQLKNTRISAEAPKLKP